MVNEIGVRRKNFLYSCTELSLYHHQVQKYNRVCFMKYTFSSSSLRAELWWPEFSFLSCTGSHRSPTAPMLSNCHSWLALPSHGRKYKSFLFPCTTASMHFPEKMWTIIPFWKVRRKGKQNKSVPPTVSQQTRKFVRFVLIIKRIIEVMWTGPVRDCNGLVNV